MKDRDLIFLSKFKKEFIACRSSSYTTYSNPQNLYENLINAIAIGLETHRKDSYTSGLCPVESRYKEIKNAGFLSEDVEKVVQSALKVLGSKKGSTVSKQKEITSFFFTSTPVSKPAPPKAISVDEGASGSSNNTIETESIEKENAKPTKQLFKILQGECADFGSVDPDLDVICESLIEPTTKYLKTETLIESSGKYFLEHTKHGSAKKNVDDAIDTLKENLSDLKEESNFDPETLMGKNTREKATMWQLKADREAEASKKCLKSALFLQNCLKKMAPIQSKWLRNRSYYLKRQGKGGVVIESINSDLDWNDCLSNIEAEKAGTGLLTLADFKNLKNYFSMMKVIGSDFTTTEEVHTLLQTTPGHKYRVLKEIVNKLPVVKVSFKNKTVLLDSVEFLESGQKIVELMNCVKKMKNEETLEADDQTNLVPQFDEEANDNDSSTADNVDPSFIEEIIIEVSPPGIKRKLDEKTESPQKKRKLNEPLSKWKNPEILTGIENFVESSGLSANYRRRNEISETGVSMPMVRDFVQTTFFPDNPDSAPSTSTLRRLFKAPHLGRASSHLYKGVINARLGFKRNDKCARDLHKNTHHCFTEVKTAREFASLHSDEICTLSCDDKAKIPVGPPIVHRLTTLRKFFIDDNIPNLPDHDIRGLGLIVPCGYEVLEKKVIKEEDDDDTKSAQTLTNWNEGEDNEVHDSEFMPAKGMSNMKQTKETKEREKMTSKANKQEESEMESLAQAGKHEGDEDRTNPVIKNPANFFPFCFCKSTHIKNICVSCGKRTCDFCSFNGEDGGQRLCKKCHKAGFKLSQLDGICGDSDSEDEFSVMKPVLSSTRRIESESSEDDSNDDQRGEKSKTDKDDESSVENTDKECDTSNNNRPERFNQTETTQVKDELGRPRIVCPNTGTSYIFLRNNDEKPSTIARHVSDIFNLLKTERIKTGGGRRSGLLLILDDGQDYGMRSVSTVHCLGKLFLLLDLDILMVVKNSPGCSRFNPIEHLWGFITPKLAGTCLPTKLMEDGGEEEARIGDDKDGDNSYKIVDQGSKIVSSLLENLKYDGFDVVPVPVGSRDENIEIKSEKLKEDKIDNFEEIEAFYHSTKKGAMLRKENAKLFNESQFIYEHADCRTHSVYFRKCRAEHGDEVCKRCKKFPPRGSESLWKDLPQRSSGGLFYTPTKDGEHPNHNQTLIQLLSHPPFTILPDNNIEDVDRCKEPGCLYVFKSVADQERHLRIVHEKTGRDLRPQGFQCSWVLDQGKICGEKFPTYHFLNKHKTAMKHKTSRKKSSQAEMSDPED